MPSLPTDGLAIRWTTRWWDPMLRGYGPPAQDIAVYADGTVVGASTVDAEVQPMVWPYLTGTIPRADVEALLTAADAAGLLESPGPVDGNDAVVGAPVTFVELRTAGATVGHQVHALQSPSDADTQYLAGLRGFVAMLQDATAAALDPSTAPYAETTRVAIVAVPVEPTAGRAVTEWEGAFPLTSACTVTDDATTIAMLQQHIARDVFSDAGNTYFVSAYQLVPGETACFGDPGVAAPDEAATPAIRITTQPLFPVTPPFVGAGPTDVVFADGRVLAPTQVSFAAAPWAWPYDEGRVAPAEVADLLALADELGLLEAAEPRLPRSDVADAPVTTFVLSVDGRQFTHRAEALDSPPADDPTGYYARLDEFRDAVVALVDANVEIGEFYRPTHWMVVSAPVTDDYPGVAWTGPVPLADLTECRVVDGDAWFDLFGTAGAGGGVLTETDAKYRLAARVAFPGETC